MNAEKYRAHDLPIASEICVAIATLDRPAALIRCLRALLSSRVLPAEILVVDQSLNRETQKAIEQLGQVAVPVLYLKQDLLGLSASRNAAIHHSDARIMAFSDDDCVPEPTWVETIARSLDASSSIAGISGRVLPLNESSLGAFMVSPRSSQARRDYNGKSIPWLVGTGGNFAVKREWLNRVGDFDERLGAGSPGKAAEDGDLIYRLLRAGARLRYEPEMTVYHELQTKERRLASRWGYGHGIGAMCGIWLRRRESYAAFILFYWLSSLARELARSAVQREGFEAYQRWLGLKGTAHGLLYGVRLAPQLTSRDPHYISAE